MKEQCGDGQSKPEQTVEWIKTTLLSLRVGDKVVINDRNRPLTLVERFWDDRESGYWRYRFEGYGTHYDIVVPPAGRGSVSILRTAGGKEILLNRVERQGLDEKIVSDTSAKEWLDSKGIDVR